MCIKIHTVYNKFKDLLLEHVRDYPQQESGSIDYPVLCVRYMEQLLNRENFDIHWLDVLFLWLYCFTQILLDSMQRKVTPSVDKETAVKDATCKKDDGRKETSATEEDVASIEITI